MNCESDENIFNDIENEKELLSVVKTYINLAQGYRHLTKEEEYEYILKAQNNDEEAINTLIFSNFFYIYSIAKSYMSDRHDLKISDLLNSAFIGVIKAIKKFDTTTNNRFKTYSTPWIKAEIIREIDNTGRLIRIPVNVNQDVHKLRKIIDKYTTAYGKEPTNEELSQLSKFSVKKIVELQKYEENPLPLDVIINDEDNISFASFLSSDDENSETSVKKLIEKREYLDIIEKNLKYLSEKEKQTLIYKYGLYDIGELSLDEISKVVEISYNCVSNYERRAIDKVRSRNGLEKKKYPRGRRRVK